MDGDRGQQEKQKDMYLLVKNLCVCLSSSSFCESPWIPNCIDCICVCQSLVFLQLHSMSKHFINLSLPNLINWLLSMGFAFFATYLKMSENIFVGIPGICPGVLLKNKIFDIWLVCIFCILSEIIFLNVSIPGICKVGWCLQ